MGVDELSVMEQVVNTLSIAGHLCGSIFLAAVVFTILSKCKSHSYLQVYRKIHPRFSLSTTSRASCRQYFRSLLCFYFKLAYVSKTSRY